MPLLALSPNLTLHYLDVNPVGRRTVLLLHGLGATSRSWRPQITALAGAGYRILAPDLRGFGQSTYPGRTSLAEMAQDVAGLLRAVAPEPVGVVGISMGGAVALHLALDQPSLVRSQVLVNTSARLRPRHPGGWLNYALLYLGLRSVSMQRRARLVARHTFPYAHQAELRRLLFEQIVQSNRHGYMQSLWEMGCLNLLPRLGQVRAPTIVITGADDRTIRPKNQRKLAEAITGARHVVIPRGGHGVTVDQVEGFNRALLGFLDQHHSGVDHSVRS
jgi:pimeloyl-ACP methyl ester carboxylesterase